MSLALLQVSILTFYMHVIYTYTHKHVCTYKHTHIVFPQRNTLRRPSVLEKRSTTYTSSLFPAKQTVAADSGCCWQYHHTDNVQEISFYSLYIFKCKVNGKVKYIYILKKTNKQTKPFLNQRHERKPMTSWFSKEQ